MFGFTATFTQELGDEHIPEFDKLYRDLLKELQLKGDQLSHDVFISQLLLFVLLNRKKKFGSTEQVNEEFLKWVKFEFAKAHRDIELYSVELENGLNSVNEAEAKEVDSWLTELGGQDYRTNQLEKGQEIFDEFKLFPQYEHPCGLFLLGADLINPEVANDPMLIAMLRDLYTLGGLTALVHERIKVKTKEDIAALNSVIRDLFSTTAAQQALMGNTLDVESAVKIRASDSKHNKLALLCTEKGISFLDELYKLLGKEGVVPFIVKINYSKLNFLISSDCDLGLFRRFPLDTIIKCDLKILKIILDKFQGKRFLAEGFRLEDLNEFKHFCLRSLNILVQGLIEGRITLKEAKEMKEKETHLIGFLSRPNYLSNLYIKKA